MGDSSMPTREENRHPHEVALFRSIDPRYGHGTKPDFDAYFAQHGYPYGGFFTPHNTPSLPYNNYGTTDAPFGSYHRPTYACGYNASHAYGRYGPHYGHVVSPEDFSHHLGGHIGGHLGYAGYDGRFAPGPFAPGQDRKRRVRMQRMHRTPQQRCTMEPILQCD